MRGDFLLFWDSDVIMESTAVARSLEILKKESADMIQSCVTEVTVGSADEISEKWQEWETKYPRQENTRIVDSTGTSNLLISKKVLKQLAFDPDLTFFEDQDFTSRATKQGFKILATRSVIGFDVNSNKSYSSIYAFDMPLKEALRGIRKKGIIQAQNVTVRFLLDQQSRNKILFGKQTLPILRWLCSSHGLNGCWSFDSKLVVEFNFSTLLFALCSCSDEEERICQRAERRSKKLYCRSSHILCSTLLLHQVEC